MLISRLADLSAHHGAGLDAGSHAGLDTYEPMQNEVPRGASLSPAIPALISCSLLEEVNAVVYDAATY